MMLFIGIGSYGVARLLSDYRPRWALLMAVGATGAGLIRSHMALLIILAALVAVAAGRGPKLQAAAFRRMVTLGVMLASTAAVVTFVISDFGIDVSAGVSDALVEDELDPIFAGVEDQTDKGGSAVQGGAIRAIGDIPQALVRVLFSPLPHEAHNSQALVNSVVEGTFLLALFLWRGPAIIRNFRKRWRDPYVTYALAFTAGFVFGHSAVLNLGIIARQRSQVIPFVIVLLVELGAGRVAAKRGADPSSDSPSNLRQKLEAASS